MIRVSCFVDDDRSLVRDPSLRYRLLRRVRVKVLIERVNKWTNTSLKIVWRDGCKFEPSRNESEFLLGNPSMAPS